MRAQQRSTATWISGISRSGRAFTNFEQSSSLFERLACAGRQNRKRDHPRPSFPETTRVDGMKDAGMRVRVQVALERIEVGKPFVPTRQ